MSGRLSCYKQQQHSKLLAQFVFKVSVFHFIIRVKTRAPLRDCRINNAMIQFVPSCQYTQMQFIDVLDPPFSDIACMWIFMPKNSIVTEFCHLALGGPVIMPHRVVVVADVNAGMWNWCGISQSPIHLFVLYRKLTTELCRLTSDSSQSWHSMYFFRNRLQLCRWNSSLNFTELLVVVNGSSLI